MYKLQVLALFVVLCSLVLTFVTADECAKYPGTETCKVIPHCKNGQQVINAYWLTNTPTNTWTPGPQNTTTTICHDGTQFIIEEDAQDRYPRSTPKDICNYHVWEGASALELFISRVASPYDIPQNYFEIDTTPTGTTFGSIINNAKGNTTTCAQCDFAEMKCTGKSDFVDYKGLMTSTRTTPYGWATTRYLPFTIFNKFVYADEQRYGKGINKNTFFRVNFYRYDYPTQSGGYVLSGANPTWSPSFHIPSRMMTFIVTDLN